MAKRISGHLEREVHRLHALGHSLSEIGRMVECSRKAVSNVLVRVPGACKGVDASAGAAVKRRSRRDPCRARARR